MLLLVHHQNQLFRYRNGYYTKRCVDKDDNGRINNMSIIANSSSALQINY